MEDFIETLKNQGNFSQLLGLIDKSGLNQLLMQGKKYTLFAPDDDAFSRLPDGELQKIESDDKLLPELTQYHIVEGEYSLNDLINFEEVETLQGNNLRISSDDSTVYINDAQVIKSDLKCSNGVIQVIDLVLAPAK